MRIVNLASGSKGNSTFIEYGTCKVLIDVGISEKRIRQELFDIGEKLEDISAVLITHEHSDHIKSLEVLARKFDFDVFVHEELVSSNIIRNINFKDGKLKTFSNQKFCVGEIEFCPFELSHDAIYTVGFVANVHGSNAKVGFITDAGFAGNSVVEALSGVKMVFIESNYDEEMIDHGHYPYLVKKRIKSEFGHLSNLQSIELASKLYKLGTKCFILSHISENNNTNEKAFLNYANFFQSQGLTLDNDVVIRLSFAKKHGNNFILNEEFIENE